MYIKNKNECLKMSMHHAKNMGVKVGYTKINIHGYSDVILNQKEKKKKESTTYWKIVFAMIQ